MADILEIAMSKSPKKKTESNDILYKVIMSLIDRIQAPQEPEEEYGPISRRTIGTHFG